MLQCHAGVPGAYQQYAYPQKAAEAQAPPSNASWMAQYTYQGTAPGAASGYAAAGYNYQPAAYDGNQSQAPPPPTEVPPPPPT